MINYDLLDATLDYIEEHPQQWHQEAWFAWLDPVTRETLITPVTVEMEEENRCGSAFCFAGHAALKSGFPAPPRNNFMPWTDGQGTLVDSFARQALGLTYGQADVLFDSSNTMDDLRAIVKKLHEDPKASADDLMDVVSWGAFEYEEDIMLDDDPETW